MSKDINIKEITTSAKRLLHKLQHYAGFAFIITILCAYTFLVFRIGTLSQAEPTDDALTEQTNTVRRLKIDQNAINKIEQLEDQNIGVQSLFESARDNPFQD